MQIINYKWKYTRGKNLQKHHRIESWQPEFMISDGTNHFSQKLLNEKISFLLGDKKCIGYFSGGKRTPCPNNKTLFSGNMCSDCQKLDDWFGCIRCSGMCVNPKQREGCSKNQYHIYLASFDYILKVGMSFDMRFQNRLIEQGADFGTKIVSLKDGMLARQTEQKISKLLDLPDRVTGEAKQGMIFGNPNTASINISRAIKKLRTTDVLVNPEPEIYDFRKYYRLDKIIKKPAKFSVKEGSILDGKIVAAKGNVLVMENNRRYYSFNAHSLVGRNVSIVGEKSASL
jgi:hypothetical protein